MAAVGGVTLTIRDAEPADRPALIDLWVAAWRDTFPAIDFVARRSWLDAHLDTLIGAGAKLVVVDDENGLAGFVTVDPLTGELDQLAVAPDRQGRGVAAQMLAYAKVVSPQGLRLSVNADNRRAVHLYGRAGFVVTGTGHNERSGLPVLHMAWDPTAPDP